jgi:hypothetical protein
MTMRTARAWALLAGLGALVIAGLETSVAVDLAAGAFCIACAAALVRLDGLRRSGRRARRR